MKFSDKLKLAVHSLITNKTRTVLTIIIVFVVSTLITTIMVFSINFIENISNVQKEYLNSSKSYVYITKGYEVNGRFQNEFFLSKEIEEIIDVSLEYDSVCSSVILNDSSYFFFDLRNQKNLNQYQNHETLVDVPVQINSFYHPLNVDRAVIDGDIWSKEDVGTNHIWVTDSFINRLYDEGVLLKIGDSIWLHNVYYDYFTDNSVFYSNNYIIKGIISKQIMNDYLKDISSYSFRSDIYLDMSYFIDNYLGYNTYSLQIEYFPPQADLDYKEIYQQTESMVQEITNKIDVSSGQNIAKVNSSILETLRLLLIMSILILVIAALLSIFILALSVGSIANTIIISVDKNKKHLGLMKALGLKQKAVEEIVKLEAIINITIGIVISTIAVILSLSLFQKLMEMIITNLFTYELLNINYQTYTFFPFYLPIFITAFFILLTFIFSRSSLRDISKMDVISIISEVS